VRRLIGVAAALLAASATGARAENNLGGGSLQLIAVGGKDGAVDTRHLPLVRLPDDENPVAPVFAPPPSPEAAIDPRQPVAPQFLRQEVDYTGTEQPGAIVVDTRQRFLYWVLPGGRAIRYGVGIGRPGFGWTGVKTVTRKAVWPDWTPPDEMLFRRPELPDHLAGGPLNPLGARALYLGSSLYRIHGTNEPWTIGHEVSSGCIRMMNEDVIDLYGRAKIGTKVVVM